MKLKEIIQNKRNRDRENRMKILKRRKGKNRGKFPKRTMSGTYSETKTTRKKIKKRR